MLKKEFKLFILALMFFTRIPCPSFDDFEEADLNEASRYFSVVGLIVGFLSFVAFYAASQYFSTMTSVIFSLAFSVFITGAFHEDGFADTVDGFGGGWTKEKILEIMKDSRVGAFGVVGLILLFALKISLLIETVGRLETVYALCFFLTANSLSRAASASLIFTSSYVQEDKVSKAKPLATAIGKGSFIFLIICGLLPLLIMKNPLFFIAVIPVFLTSFLAGKYFEKWIGGYTGDCLGATQQICEIVFMASFAVILKFV